MKKLFAITLPIIAIIVGIFLYPRLPDQVPSHWNAQGEVDDYSSKTFGLFFTPILALVFALLLIYIPRIDPKKANWDQFMDPYLTFVDVFVIYMMGIHVVTTLVALGYNIDITVAIAIALAILFSAIGWFLGQAKQNWFAGIRTPWTLSNEETWDSTHKLASKLFYIAGVLTFVAVLDTPFRLIFMIGPVIIASLVSVVYSYFDYTKREKATST